VGVPEGGELGRAPSCLDVPVQEWVWAHKGASVYVLEHTVVLCLMPRRLSRFPQQCLNKVLSIMGLSFPFCGSCEGLGLELESWGGILGRERCSFHTLYLL
jgi:hypothetical protein